MHLNIIALMSSMTNKIINFSIYRLRDNYKDYDNQLCNRDSNNKNVIAGIFYLAITGNDAGGLTLVS